MGQHFSKSPPNSKTQQQQSQQQQQQQQHQEQKNVMVSSSIIDTDQNHVNNVRTLNIQNNHSNLLSAAFINSNSIQHILPANIIDNSQQNPQHHQSSRRFIIKIQLTKMESDRISSTNHEICDNFMSATAAATNDTQTETVANDTNLISVTTETTTIQVPTAVVALNNNCCNFEKDNTINNNLNITTPRSQILNFKFTKNIPCDLMNVVLTDDQQHHQQHNMNINNKCNFDDGARATSSSDETPHSLATSICSNNHEIKLNNCSNQMNIDSSSNNFVNNLNPAPFIDAECKNSNNNNLNKIINFNNNDALNGVKHKTSRRDDIVHNYNDDECSKHNHHHQHNNNRKTQNIDNNFNITIQKFQDFTVIENNTNKKKNISGADYQDVPDINQRVPLSTPNKAPDKTETSNNTKRNCTSNKDNSRNPNKTKGNSNPMCGNNTQDQKSHCCRRKSSSSSSTGVSIVSAYPSKWRCCKCACRDAVKKIVNSSSGGGGSNNGQSSSSSATTTASSGSGSSGSGSGGGGTSNCQNKMESSKCTSSKSGNIWTSRFSCANKKDNTQHHHQHQQQTKSNLNSNEKSSSSILVTPAILTTPSLPLPPPSSSSSSSAVTISSITTSPLQQPQSQPIQFNTNLSEQTINGLISVPLMTTQATVQQAGALAAQTLPPGTNHLAIWSPNEVIFPITARPGEILVLQCPQNVVCRIEDLDERARRLRAIEIETGVDSLSQSELDVALASTPWHPIICTPTAGISFTATPVATVVHSRVDFIHCLVPDLEKITSSSFYWGKMDRYEAERLLEGKPEGTFLLRDSAQEEYLFSVTFRKYGRSLHARIEQFNHKFSFDCHDPGVFTAPTVTRLLEHYKDPSCVMFFEPMLTIPLNRNFSFSLQQLCRATIVSNISYDGIKELQLPNSLKGYLKEYHYKLRVRVKPFDETFYS